MSALAGSRVFGALVGSSFKIGQRQLYKPSPFLGMHARYGSVESGELEFEYDV